MPFIKVNTGAEVTKNKDERIKSAMGLAITAIPGKSEGRLMTEIEGGKSFYFKGTDKPAAMVGVRHLRQSAGKRFRSS